MVEIFAAIHFICSQGVGIEPALENNFINLIFTRVKTSLFAIYSRVSFAMAVTLTIAFLAFGLNQVSAQCQPQFSGDPEDLSVNCGEDIPEFSDCQATSTCCDGPVTVTSFTSETGAIVHDCVISTANGPGIDWAIWLPELGAPSVAWNFVGEGHLQVYADGTGHLWGLVANAGDPSLQWNVDLWLHNGADWAAWSAMGRSYKNDLGYAGQNYIDWMYYELVPGFADLTGAGALEGSRLELSHLPADFFYGFQMGIGANNKNGNDGFSGWFTYTGTYNGASVSGHGDVNVNESCIDGNVGCAATAWTKICRAEDECGHLAVQTQTVSVIDNVPPTVDPYEPVITIACEFANDIFITATDNCSSVNITYQDEIITPGCGGSLIRHYAIHDGCGNTSYADQTIYLLGEGEPEFTVFPEDITISCELADELADPQVEWLPGCANTQLNVVEELTPGTCPGSYTMAYTYTLTDACGNEVSQVWVVTVEDTTPPQIFDVPANMTISCGQAIPPALPFAADNCDGEVTLSLSATTDSSSCGYSFIRTWTATDACGNSTTAIQTIHVSDAMDPIFTFLPESVTVNCDQPFELDLALVEDQCSRVELTWTDVPLGDCAGSYMRIWRAFDGCGNQALESTVVTLVDANAPVMTSFPEDVTVNCDEIPSVSEDMVQYHDNCGTVETTYDEEIVPGSCGGSYEIHRTWTLTDDCNNSSEWTWTITVVDNNPPVLFGIPENTTLNCGDEVSEAVVDAIDDCDVSVNVSLTATTVQNECGYDFIRTWIATDDCGNTSSASQTITVLDNESPVFTFVPSNISLGCDGTTGGDPMEMAEATDACSEVTITFEDEVGEGGCSGGIIRHWLAVDGCGNTATADQIISVSDLSAPVITSFPEDMTVSCGNIPSSDDAGVSFEDDCGNVITEFNEVQLAGDCANEYVLERTWTFTDACGNAVSDTWVITVIDDVAPQIIGVPDNSTSTCGNPVEEAVVAAIDNCSAPENIQLSLNAYTVPNTCGYTFVREWTAIDECGNQTVASQTIEVFDNVPPVFTFVPGDMTLSCDGGSSDPIEMAEATDECSAVVVTFEDEIGSGGCSGGIIRHWIATDGCGNSVTADQNISVSDQEAPVITSFPDDMTVSCDAIPTIESADVTYSDDCGNLIVQVNEVVIPGECANSSTIERTWLITDGCGNTATGTWVINVVDEQGPTILGVPESTTISCGEEISEAVVSAIDNCSSPENIELTLNAFTEPASCGYVFVRVWTATDECGNSTELTQEITVTDNALPIFTFIPADISVSCGEAYELLDATATDVCSDVTVTVTESEPNCAGGFARTFTAVDGCGNEATATQQITITDNIDPIAEFVPENLNTTCNNVPVYNATDVVFTDNCSAVSVEFTSAIVAQECEGTYLIQNTWQGTDACGNRTTVTNLVQVTDNDAPQFNGLPEDLFLECGDITPLPAQLTATDDCSGVTVTSVDVTVPTDCGYVIERTYTATDDCGNSTEYMQNITFTDNDAPVFSSLPADMMLDCGETVPDVEFISAEDFCTGAVEVTIAEIITAGNCPANYTITRTYTATDACGNTAEHVQIISVSDETDPDFFDFASQITVSCTESEGAFVSSYDDCSEVTLTYADEFFEDSCAGYLVRTYTAEDACGNTASAIQVMDLVDTELPSFVPETLPALNSVVDCSEIPAEDQYSIFFTDDCSNATLSMSDNIIDGDCPNSYTIERTWTVTDGCSNSNTYTIQIEVQDNVAPQILGVPGDLTLECQDAVPSDVVFALDNCDVDPQIALEASTEIFGCVSYFTRRWTATDACGNLSQEIQVITFVDNTAPLLSDYPADLTIPCGSTPPTPPAITATDNCDTDVEVGYSEETVDNGGCITWLRTWCVSDCTGNSTCHTQTITSSSQNALAGPLFHVWMANSGLISMNARASETGRWIVDVFDITGRKVDNIVSTDFVAGEDKQISYDISELKDAVYYFRFSNGETELTRSIAIIR